MANDDEDSQRRWDHVRKPLSSREVHTRSQVDMHYQQQLNGNFPLSSPNPLDFSTEVGNKIFSPLFIAKVCVAVVHDTPTPSRFTTWLTRRMLAVFARGGKIVVRQERMLLDRNNNCSSAARDGNNFQQLSKTWRGRVRRDATAGFFTSFLTTKTWTLTFCT